MAGNSVQGLVVVRVIRLGRIFRLFKFSKYNRSLYLVTGALKNSINELKVMGFLIAIVVIVFASAMYFAELSAECQTKDGIVYFYEEGKPVCHEIEDGTATVYEKAFFQSIPDAMWWCIVTITTVGYGDTYPRTTAGRAVACVAMFIGIVIIAFPITVIGTNFNEIWGDMKEELRLKKLQMEKEKTPINPTLATMLQDLENVQNDLEVQLALANDKLTKYKKSSAHLVDEIIKLEAGLQAKS